MEDGLVIKKGDILKVFQKVVEGKKERISSFTGKVITVKGSGMQTMFTIRQTLEGVAVDRIYPLHAPVISKIEKIVEMKKEAPAKKAATKKTSKKKAS